MKLTKGPWLTTQHPLGPRRKRRAKSRKNNKVWTLSRITYNPAELLAGWYEWALPTTWRVRNLHRYKDRWSTQLKIAEKEKNGVLASEETQTSENPGTT